MSLQVEKLENNMAKLTIEVGESDFEKAMQSAYIKNRNRINIPGFRKGKAPRQMIEKMYGAGIFYEDAANALIPEAYSKALDESELVIVSQPEIDVVQIEKGKPFIFTAEVAVKPEVELGAYRGIEVPKTYITVSDEEIDTEIKKEQDNNSRMITVEDRAVQDGDIVTLDFEGFLDGEAFPGGKGEDYKLTVGSGTFIPGFEEKLIGAALDTPGELQVTFPEDYQAEELAGKEATFTYTVKKIEYKELPELDDDFAQDVSEFDTMDEYREDVRKNLVEKKEAAAKTDKENAVVDKVIENAKMEIPEPMIKSQVSRMLEDFAGRIKSQGLSMEQYMKVTGTTPEQLQEQMKPQALKRIQSRLVLEAVAKAEDIQIADDRLEEELGRMAEMYRMEPDKFKELVSDAEKEQIKEDMAVQDAVTLITDAAKEV